MKESSLTQFELELKKHLNHQRWKLYFSDNSIVGKNKKFRRAHSELIYAAKLFPPKYIGNNVTDFTGWVYSLYNSSSLEDNRENGKLGERELQRIFKENLRIKRSLDKPFNNLWELDYFDQLDGQTKPLVISSLSVDGKPLYAKPDYVFKHKESGEILILDIKISDSEIPSDGWPNLRAQLWAYSHIDKYKGAPKVTLVGEIWGGNPLNRRGTIRWQANDEKFIAENKELFLLYKSLAIFQSV